MKPNNDRRYSDLDFQFFCNPITQDVSKKINDNAIKQSIKNLILMRRYDCPFHPEVYSQVGDMLFDNVNTVSLAMLRRAIVYTLENFEPRIRVIDVTITNNSDQHMLDITIKYLIVATGVVSDYNFVINRTR